MATTSLRETVLQAAVEHIAEHGPDGLSFRQVAAAAGVSHQAPYHHFSDRKGIFQAIALEGFTMFAAALREAEAQGGDDPSTSLLQAYVDFAVEHTGHFRVMFRPELTCIGENPELAAVAGESFDVLLDHVQQQLGSRSSVAEVRERAVTMWSVAHGLATLLIDGPLEQHVGPLPDRRALTRAVAMQTGLSSPRR